MPSADGHDGILTPTDSDVNSPELDIPEARDGFFGYPEEKTQHHVCHVFLTDDLSLIP